MLKIPLFWGIYSALEGISISSQSGVLHSSLINKSRKTRRRFLKVCSSLALNFFALNLPSR